MRNTWALLVAGLVLLAILIYVFQREAGPPPAEDPPAAPAPEPEPLEPAEPVYQPPPAPAPEPEAAPPDPLPPLGESDPVALETAGRLAGPEAGRWLVEENVVRRLVATVDNLDKDRVRTKVRAVPPVDGRLAVTTEGERLYLAPENAERYDGLVSLLDNLDVTAVADAYARHYPLFEEAWRELGYPERPFNDRLIGAIDHLLETPEVELPVELERPHVLYRYADPELEALSAGQKALIRMGPEHAARVKRALAELRAELVARSEIAVPAETADGEDATAEPG